MEQEVATVTLVVVVLLEEAWAIGWVALLRVWEDVVLKWLSFGELGKA
jgi:hypothetical protein